MPLSFVLDEHYRGPLWRAIQSHNLRSSETLDVVRVGDLPELPVGSLDPEILLWAEQAGRILVTEDKSTMAGHLADHLQAGHHSPGVFTPRPRTTLVQVVAFLATAAYGSSASEWEGRVTFIPC